jgi:Skp family chaperone for outer membrane proteins
MRKVVVLSVLAMFICGVFFQAGQAYAKELKIGYVNAVKILYEYNKAKEMMKGLEAKSKAKDAEYNNMLEELRKLKDEQALLSDKAKAEKQVILDNKFKALQDFRLKARNELMKDESDMLASIRKDIEKVAADYSKTSGYDMVLDSNTLLYGSADNDLTNEVLSRLNK